MTNQGNSFVLELPYQFITVEANRLISYSSKINVPIVVLVNDTGHKKVAKKVTRAYTRSVTCSWQGSAGEYEALESYLALFKFKDQDNPLMYLNDYITPVPALEGLTSVPLVDLDGFSPSEFGLKFGRYKAVITSLSRTRVFSDVTIQLGLTVYPVFEPTT